MIENINRYFTFICFTIANFYRYAWKSIIFFAKIFCKCYLDKCFYWLNPTVYKCADSLAGGERSYYLNCQEFSQYQNQKCDYFAQHVRKYGKLIYNFQHLSCVHSSCPWLTGQSTLHMKLNNHYILLNKQLRQFH